MSTISYQTFETVSEKNIKYYFISNGKTPIIKAIEYTYLSDYNGKKIFNLAFGDYIISDDRIDDSAHSANGDVYKVFNTVLNTIPKLFENFPDAIMMVEGSDSRLDFIEKCKAACVKYCVDIDSCKNKNRRINVYRKYVDSNFTLLSNEYAFFGGLRSGNFINIEPYILNKEYDSVFVNKK